MRVYYDGLIYATQAAGGINRLFAELIDRLPGDIEPTLATAYHRPSNFPTRSNLRMAAPLSATSDAKVDRLPAIARRSIAFRRAQRRTRFDIYHPTYYLPQTLGSLRRIKAPTVVTVYDLTYELFKDELDPHGTHRFIMRRAVQNADAVICISENTRRDLLQHYRVPEERIRTIYPGNALTSALVQDDEHVPDVPFVLFVGSRAAYKDFDVVLRALATAADALRDVRICIVGSALTDSEWGRIDKLRLRDRILEYGRASDAHLAALYAASIALVYPSRYEGFGIPPVEAMACGTIAIAANASSVPEVVGEAGLLFEPGDADGLARLIEIALTDTARRRELLTAGAARAQHFTWDRMATQTATVYHDLLG